MAVERGELCHNFDSIVVVAKIIKYKGLCTDSVVLGAVREAIADGFRRIGPVLGTSVIEVREEEGRWPGSLRSTRLAATYWTLTSILAGWAN